MTIKTKGLFLRVNYISTEGNKGYIVPDYYVSREVARQEALNDPDIATVTSVIKQKPYWFEEE